MRKSFGIPENRASSHGFTHEQCLEHSCQCRLVGLTHGPVGLVRLGMGRYNGPKVNSGLEYMVWALNMG